MPPPPQTTINATVIPTGGAISLTFVTASGGNILLSRATSGVSGLSEFTPLYSGMPLNTQYGDQLYLDLGENLPGNILLPNAQYVYQLTDSTGTYTTPALTPVSSLQLQTIDFVPILISLLQGAITATQLPNGINKCRVLQAMPINGLPPMPFVVVNPDLIQQEYVPIGESVYNLGGQLQQPNAVNIFTQAGSAKNVFRISIFALSAVERDFYRDLIIAVFRISLISVFQSLGVDWEHHYQATSFQATEVGHGLVPGFYGADILLELLGTSNVTIITHYGIIETITGTFSGASGSVTLAHVPVPVKELP